MGVCSLSVWQNPRAGREGRIELHGRLARYRSSSAFDRYLHEACRTEWVVYAKPPFDGPERVLEYLVRYTHRIAISNHRLLHVLPKGLVRIRHYGFLANGCRARLLARCRGALGRPEDTHLERASERSKNNEPFLELLPPGLRLCPHCGLGPMRCIEVLGRPPPSRHRSRRVAA